MTYAVAPPPLVDDSGTQTWFSSLFRFIQSDTGVVSKSANYGVEWNVFWVRMDAAGGARTITLPSAAGNKGRKIGGIKTEGGGNSVTFAASGTDTVNGTATLGTQWAAAVFISDGVSNWDRVT